MRLQHREPPLLPHSTVRPASLRRSPARLPQADFVNSAIQHGGTQPVNGVTLPSSLGNIATLTFFMISNVDLRGGIPSWISSATWPDIGSMYVYACHVCSLFSVEER